MGRSTSFSVASVNITAKHKPINWVRKCKSRQYESKYCWQIKEHVLQDSTLTICTAVHHLQGQEFGEERSQLYVFNTKSVASI